MKFLVTFRPNWWIIGAIFEEICIYVEENEGFGQPLIPFILLIGELQMGPYMVTYWCVSECCSLIGSHHLYVYRNVHVVSATRVSTKAAVFTAFSKMDPLVYVAAASVILILIVLLTFLRKTVKEGKVI